MKFDMVFEGGGAKGIAFLGALAELEARGIEPDRIVGTSAGAIFATLLAAGFDAKTLHDAVARRDEKGVLLLNRFFDKPVSFTDEEVKNSTFMKGLERIDIPFIPNNMEAKIELAFMSTLLKLGPFRQAFSIFEAGGVFAGDAFIEWLTSLLNERKAGLGSATMAEFFAYTGRDLSLVVTDVDARLMLVLNHRTAPKVPIVYAVRMSMSIPMLWQEIVWQESWGKYLDRTLTGHTLSDGGLLSNFPMHLIATQLDEVKLVMGEADPLKVPNVGFLIDESLRDGRFEPEKDKEREGMLASTMRRLTKLWQALITSRDQLVLERCLQNHEVCRLPVRGYQTTEFDMSPERFEVLVQAGQDATKRYFDARGV